MSASARAQGALRFDYVAVGHVTADVLADGSRQAGGSALYAALQAARLGLRAHIVTSGVPAEVEELLRPYRSELDVDIRRAAATTTLTASGWGRARSQHVVAWAGPIAGEVAVEARILHLAPVAREVCARHAAAADLVGLTPQGLARRWPQEGGEISLAPPWPDALELARACDAVVISEQERTALQALIDAATGAGALAVQTAGSRPVIVDEPGGARTEIAVAPLAEAVDDLGAGDVFAAALFVARADGRPLREAVAFAMAAAAVRMAGRGADAIGDASAIAQRISATAG